MYVTFSICVVLVSDFLELLDRTRDKVGQVELAKEATLVQMMAMKICIVKQN
jgi:hypothetical protein